MISQNNNMIITLCISKKQICGDYIYAGYTLLNVSKDIMASD